MENTVNSVQDSWGRKEKPSYVANGMTKIKASFEEMSAEKLPILTE